MNANQIINALISEEMDGANAPDMRRILRDERQTLTVVLARGNRQEIQAAMAEAVNTASMWGVDLTVQP